MVDPHFLELRARIEKLLPNNGTQPPKWLYGALGDPRSKVMFICENPSERGVKIADKKYGHLDIDAQWQNSMFRDVLVECGLKLGGRDTPGDWHCYITNFIKQVDKASEWDKKPGQEKKNIAGRWLDILRWEIDQVDPRIVFCVGNNVWGYVGFFQSEGLLTVPNPHRIWHYSAPRSRHLVRKKMSEGIRKGLSKYQPGSSTPGLGSTL